MVRVQCTLFSDVKQINIFIPSMHIIFPVVVGYFVKERPKPGITVMDKWKKDDNMWLRRTAILHQLSRKGDTNQAWLFDCCKLRAHETEFFIQKAIGWALREYARTNPSAVRKFVTQNKQKLSRLSTREAMKHL